MRFYALILTALVLSSCKTTNSSSPSTSFPIGFESIFDGEQVRLETFQGDNVLNHGWKIKDSALITPNGLKVDALTLEDYVDFHLIFDFKLHKNSNSGVKIMIRKQDGPIGPEYQILDSVNHSDGKNGKNRHTSSLYDVFIGKPELAKPLEIWNQGEIIVKGNRVEHRLNGKSALVYYLGSDKILGAKLKSKFKNKEFFGLKRKGRILFQGHGEVVSYRNIKVKRL